MYDTTSDTTDDESTDTIECCCSNPTIARVPWRLREWTDHFKGVFAQCKNCTTRFDAEHSDAAVAIATESRDICDECGKACTPTQVVELLDGIREFCEDCAKDWVHNGHFTYDIKSVETPGRTK